MPARLFGTDGVRGVANGELTAELALGIAASAVRVLHTRDESSPHSGPGRRPTVVVGRDTRPSGEFLEAAVVAGPGRGGGGGRPAAGPPPGARGRGGGRRRGCRSGGVAAGEPQPDAGQRDQAVRRR